MIRGRFPLTTLVAVGAAWAAGCVGDEPMATCPQYQDMPPDVSFERVEDHLGLLMEWDGGCDTTLPDRVQVFLNGTACDLTQVRTTYNQTSWSTGHFLVFTPASPGCGMEVAGSQPVRIEVFIEGIAASVQPPSPIP